MAGRRLRRQSARAILWLFLTVPSSLPGIPVAQSDPQAGDLAAEWRRLEDRQLGYALRYPVGWAVEGQIVATEFAAGSRCRSVRVVDFEPPPGTGPAAQIRHSFLQVCGKPIAGGNSLEDFMRQTYGALLARTFAPSDLNGLPAYRSRDDQDTKMIFTEIRDHRIQIYVAVVADTERYPMRRAQVEKILASFATI